MNYEKIYDKLMLRAELRVRPTGYTEAHHKLPRSIGGAGTQTVRLTAREHLVAHKLLTRFVPTGFDPTTFKPKMYLGLWAVVKMSRGKAGKLNSREFEKVRTEVAAILSAKAKVRWADPAERAKASKRSSNWTTQNIVEFRNKMSKVHKGKIVSLATRAKLSKAHTGKDTSIAARQAISIANAGKKRPKRGPLKKEHSAKLSTPCTVHGNKYASIKEACEVTGMTAYFIKRDPSYARLISPSS